MSVWNNIARVKREFLKDGINFDEAIKKQVGEGDNTLFCLDKWLDNENLKSMFLGLKVKNVKLGRGQRLGGITQEWKSSPSSNSQAREFDELAFKVESFLPNTEPDRWVCNISGDGVYHVNVVREQIDKESSSIEGGKID
uniref:Uncharacterized protein n=1 Tax=Lactuca sativa TaxID=4236 RepID=A0A9R1WJF8_LACSA|nr:hypothetical protein LSAT_V11C200099040 [Lactuca sativa]